MNILEIVNFIKEWASLILAFIGIFISWKTNKLANENAFKKQIALWRSQEIDANRETKKKFNDIYKNISIKLDNYLNESCRIVKVISDKEIDLINTFSPLSQLQVIELHKVINSHFMKKVFDIIEKYQQLEEFIWLTRLEMNDSNSLFYYCLSCEVIYWKNSSSFLFDTIKIIQDQLRNNKNKYNSSVSISWPDYREEFEPYVSALEHFIKYISSNFVKISICENSSFKININSCQECQKKEIKDWWNCYYPQINFEPLRKLLVQGSRG